MSFCEWLSRLSGYRYRLPTEAEWERAARGGVEGALYAWGDAAPETLPNYATRWREGPEPAGLYAPNAYGLFNMGDNVHEWCADWYDPRYYEHSPARNPSGPPREAGKLRGVVPGGTTSKSRVAQPARAFPRSSSTPTTDFASPAKRFRLPTTRLLRRPALSHTPAKAATV